MICITWNWASGLIQAKRSDYVNLYINDNLIFNAATTIPEGRFMLCNSSTLAKNYGFDNDWSFIETPMKLGDKFTIKFKRTVDKEEEADWWDYWLSSLYIDNFSNVVYNLTNSGKGLEVNIEQSVIGYIPTNLKVDSDGLLFHGDIYGDYIM